MSIVERASSPACERRSLSCAWISTVATASLASAGLALSLGAAAASFAAGAAVLMAALADQTSLPWSDEFPRKLERDQKSDETDH